MRLSLVLALVAAPAVGLAAETAQDRYGPPPVLRGSGPAPVSYPTHQSATAAAAEVAPQGAAYNGRFLTWSSKAGLRGPQGAPAQAQAAPQRPAQLATATRAPAPFLRGASDLPQSIYDRPAPPPSAAPPPPRRDPSEDYPPYAAQAQRPAPYQPPQRQAYAPPPRPPVSEPPPAPVRQAYVAPPQPAQQRQAYVAPPQPVPQRQAYVSPPRQVQSEAPTPQPARQTQVAIAQPPRQVAPPPAAPLAAPPPPPPPRQAAAAPAPNPREPWRNLRSVTGEPPYVPPEPAPTTAAPTQPVRSAALPPAQGRTTAPAAAPAQPAQTQVAAAAPQAAAPPPAPARARFYSLHRDYGDTPDPIPAPPPRAPVLIGPGESAAMPEEAPARPASSSAAVAGVF